MSDLDFLFDPKEVAVIGASASPQKIGYAIVSNLVKSGYKGKIHPINPRVKEILGLPCHPSIGEVEGPVDLAVIAVPAKYSIGVLQECGEASVKGAIIITAGFKETGIEGLKLEQELQAVGQKYGMRLVGPNCVGLMDTHTPLNASFAAGFPEKGNISFISQSGAMVIAILDWSFQAGLGFSRFISLGNKSDLDESDFIESCAADPNTRVILVYAEDISDGEKFIRVCTTASRVKPIVILKSGTSEAGAQAASSHTGALAGSNLAYDTAFRQSGVLRTDDMSDLFNLGLAFSTQPLPRGNRVAIITNSGGPAIIATDAIEKSGLGMARFEKATIDQLRENLPAESNIYNPIDVLGDARVDRFLFALERSFEDENVDSVIVIFSPTAVSEPEKIADTILEQRKKYPHKPVFAVYMGGKTLAKGKAILVKGNVPTFTFPESAVKALEGISRYADFRQARDAAPQLPLPQVDRTIVKATFYDVIKDRRVLLMGHEASQVLDAYGIPVNRSYLATSVEEACQISQKIGFPVVLKISSPRIAHKTDVGGVEIGLHSRREVEKAYNRITERVNRFMPDAPIYGIEVSKMVDEGIEVIIGMSRDIQFGPMIAFGLGGIYVNLLQDVSFRLASSLNNRKAIEEMIAETKAFTLLKGYRGQKSADIDTLIDAIYRTARLVQDFEEITEMDINPLRVYSRGATGVDVKITISKPD